MKVLCVQSKRMAEEVSGSYINGLKNDVSKLDFDLMVLPEKWITSEFDEHSEKLADVISTFENISEEHSCIVAPGSFSIRRGGFLYNSAPVISDGRLLGYQDKIALFKNENGKYDRGNEIKAFKTGRITLSVAVCYDLDFPFYAKVAIEKGSELLINPSLISREFKEMWYVYVKGRSLENRLPVVSVNSSSEMFGGGTVVTSMKPHNGGILLGTRFLGTEHFAVMESNVEEVGPFIRSRKEEDFGSYSFP